MANIKTVRKRDGSIVNFNIDKIINAISKANNETNEMTDDSIEAVAKSVVLDTNYSSCVDIEVIQDLVERNLQEDGFFDTAKAYILYREKRHRQREAAQSLMNQYNDLLFADSEDMDLKRDNANINTDAPMGIMLKLGTEGAKNYLNHYVLPEKFKEMHMKHIEHLHDADFSLITLNCLYVDLAKVLKDGFNTGHGFIREPKSIRAASSLACVIIQSSQNDCFGGQSLVGFDFALSKYVKMSFKKSFINKFKEWMRFEFYNYFSAEDYDIIKELSNKLDFDNIVRYSEYGSKGYKVNDSGIERSIGDYIRYHTFCNSIEKANIIYDLACEETREETEQAMEALIHNFNSLHSRAGSQVPFSSINTGMDTSQEGRLINKCLLDATWNGLGNGETPIFPITVFLLHKGVNLEPGDPNYDLFEYACKVSARRLFPNFLNIGSSFNEPYYKPDDYKTFASAMGCRTRVLSNVNGPEHAASRGNFAFTTINLPYLALEALRVCKDSNNNEVIDKFFELFDKYIMLGKEYLEWRFEIIARKKVYNYPFVFGQKLYMGSENLKPDDEIREALKNSSLSIGFVGLAECLKALIGKHQGESEQAQELGLKIVGHLRDMTDKFTEDTHMNWSTFATPAENFAGVALRACKREFGVIPEITDRDYFTNSFHVPVYYKIRAFEKIAIEAPYHALCNAGAISYIELDGDPSKNSKAFMRIVKGMVDADMGYVAINHPVDRDPVCGYTGIIENECPHCHRKEKELVEYSFTTHRVKKGEK